MWLLLSAILWLGNIEFDRAGDDSVTVRRNEALANAAELLNLDEDELATALSERTLTAGMLYAFLHVEIHPAIRSQGRHVEGGWTIGMTIKLTTCKPKTKSGCCT